MIDLKNKDKIISLYEFPNEVVSRSENALEHTNVACTSREDCFVYIADYFTSSVIVFDYKNKKSWAVTHPSMEPKPDKRNFTVSGKIKFQPEYGTNSGPGFDSRRGFFKILHMV